MLGSQGAPLAKTLRKARNRANRKARAKAAEDKSAEDAQEAEHAEAETMQTAEAEEPAATAAETRGNGHGSLARGKVVLDAEAQHTRGPAKKRKQVQSRFAKHVTHCFRTSLTHTTHLTNTGQGHIQHESRLSGSRDGERWKHLVWWVAVRKRRRVASQLLQQTRRTLSFLVTS